MHEHIHVAVMDYDAVRAVARERRGSNATRTGEGFSHELLSLRCPLPLPQTSPDDPIGNGVLAVRDLLYAAKNNNGVATFDVHLMYAGVMKGQLTGTMMVRLRRIVLAPC